MAVVFYMPEAGADDTASGSGNNSSASSSGGSNASSTSQSPNTTTSATQTPMQSPLVASPELLWAMWNSMYRSVPVFQYPPPPSPSPCCSARSPPCTGGEVFFPHSRSTPRTPRTPRTSVSFAAGDDSAFLTHSTPHSHSQPPQSAPAMHSHSHSHSQPQFQPIPYPHYQYTPPPTPLTANNNISGLTTASVSISTGTCMASKSAQSRLQRSHSDAQRRSRRTSAHEVERECHSEHETSWDELDDRYDNFTAGRERLQEFNGRIPPRKKKKDVPKPKKKFQTLIWPTVVSVIVVAIGCGFLVAR